VANEWESANPAGTGLSTQCVLGATTHAGTVYDAPTFNYTITRDGSESHAHAFSNKEFVPSNKKHNSSRLGFGTRRAAKSLGQTRTFFQWEIPGLDFNEDYDFLIAG